MELYGQVRRAVYVEGLSRREAARRCGIDPRTVAKMLAFSVPHGTPAHEPGFFTLRLGEELEDPHPPVIRLRSTHLWSTFGSGLRFASCRTEDQANVLSSDLPA